MTKALSSLPKIVENTRRSLIGFLLSQKSNNSWQASLISDQQNKISICTNKIVQCV